MINDNGIVEDDASIDFICVFHALYICNYGYRCEGSFFSHIFFCSVNRAFASHDLYHEYSQPQLHYYVLKFYGTASVIDSHLNLSVIGLFM